MCLGIITKEDHFPPQVTGYKVLRDDPEGLITLYYQPSRYHSLPLNEWLESDTTNIPCGRRGHYPSGWHLFTTLHDAMEYKFYESNMFAYLTIYKVIVRHILAEGLTDYVNDYLHTSTVYSCLTYVSKYIKILTPKIGLDK